MAWLEITIDTASHEVEGVAQGLTNLGFEELVIEDQQELEAFLDESRAYWDYIDEKLQKKLQGLSRIRLYIEQDDTESLARLREYAKSAGLPISAAPLPETDWEQSWKENYPPQNVGKDFVILPYWLADDSAGTRKKIILNPGLTFGTGAHPSTQMVLEEMEKSVSAGSACLDLGSGSGILSIAALRLGAAKAVGVDIDPKAEDAARENAAYNGLSSPEFTALTGSVTTDRHLMESLSRESWDVILVNIVADVIIALSPVLPQFMSSRTILICSGILDTRLNDVTAALTAAGIAVQSVHAKEEWRCITAVCK